MSSITAKLAAAKATTPPAATAPATAPDAAAKVEEQKEIFPYWESAVVLHFKAGGKRVHNINGRFYGQSKEEVAALDHYVSKGLATKVEAPGEAAK